MDDIMNWTDAQYTEAAEYILGLMDDGTDPFDIIEAVEREFNIPYSDADIVVRTVL